MNQLQSSRPETLTTEKPYPPGNTFLLPAYMAGPVIASQTSAPQRPTTLKAPLPISDTPFGKFNP